MWLVTPVFGLAFLALGSSRKIVTSLSLATVLGALMFVLFKMVLGATF